MGGDDADAVADQFKGRDRIGEVIRGAVLIFDGAEDSFASGNWRDNEVFLEPSQRPAWKHRQDKCTLQQQMVQAAAGRIWGSDGAERILQDGCSGELGRRRADAGRLAEFNRNRHIAAVSD
jgi:hypothetical protein